MRLSQGGGWFGRLAAEGLPSDVTPLVPTPFQAAHEAAVFFSSLTAIPYEDAIPDAQPVGRLSRADVVGAAVRDAASVNRDLITTASAKAWPTTYGSNPQLQHLVERLFEMQNALIDAAGARKMAADMEAVEQAAIALRGTLPEDPGAPERQHMGYRIAHLLYDTARLQNHLRAALDATRTEREQQQAPGADRAAVVEPASALPNHRNRSLSRICRRTRKQSWKESLPNPRRSGTPTRQPWTRTHGTACACGAKSAMSRTTAWFSKGRRSSPSCATRLPEAGTGRSPIRPPTSTSLRRSPHPRRRLTTAILYSIGCGGEYGEAPAPAQDSETATRAEVVHAEMADLAARHRGSIAEAAARAWPTTHERNPYLHSVTDALARLAAAPDEAPDANQMKDELIAADDAAMDWFGSLPPEAGPERQHMAFPLAYLARDVRRLEHDSRPQPRQCEKSRSTAR
ncbi:hypothetical protein ABZY81_43195 [Streptomyces sp. NPDC006514]|uniref:hypothetical protein n=1 Tax=Streptomyces sp. NPDC006514 TaxID=3154308 RepID=UPI0033A09600